METTITYDEKVRGWTSFHSFLPDWMMALNNRFFTIKDGQLYRHNEESVNRNNFYGTDYDSKVSIIFNDSPSEVKVFKSISQEGTVAWDTTLQAYESDQDETKQTTIVPSLYKEKEGMHYSHIRRDESIVSGKAIYGLGEVSVIITNDVRLPEVNSSASIGDSVYKADGTLIGTITGFPVSGIDVTLSSTAGLVVGDFLYAEKNQRVEGSQMRGYVMRVDLENSDTAKRELFAVNTEVFKSHR